jgi:hypothetical protein
MGTFVLLLLVFLFFYDTSMFKLVLGIIVLRAFLGEHNDQPSPKARSNFSKGDHRLNEPQAELVTGSSQE